MRICNLQGPIQHPPPCAWARRACLIPLSIFRFSDARGLIFLFLKGSTWYYLLDSQRPFHVFFCIGFQTCFSTRSEAEKAQNRNPQQQQTKQIGNTIIIETHPHPRAAKRLRPGRVKPLKLTTITTLSVVFPKAQRFQNEAKKEAEIEVSGTQNRRKKDRKQFSIKNIVF